MNHDRQYNDHLVSFWNAESSVAYLSDSGLDYGLIAQSYLRLAQEISKSYMDVHPLEIGRLAKEKNPGVLFARSFQKANPNLLSG